MQDDLNIISSAEQPQAQNAGGQAAYKKNPLAAFFFDYRTMFVYLISKWRSIAIFFACSIALSSALFYYISKYSPNAWCSTVKIYHQTRSEKIPSFYIPMKTETIAYIFTSEMVSKKVSASLKNAFPEYSPEMLSGVYVSVEKSKSDIINISANAPSPKMAAAIANAVADFGITEYLSQQNASVNAMISDMKFKRSEREAEISRLKDGQSKLFSSEAKIPPPQELKSLKDKLESINSAIYSNRIKISEYSTRISELARLLKETPKEIEFETTMDHTTQISLEGKLSTLKNLRKRYTDENPKVKMLVDEIQDLQEKRKEEQKKPMPSKITYRKNLNYADLELQLLNAQLEKKTIEKTLGNNLDEAEKISRRMAQINQIMPEFSDFQNKIDVLEKQIESINLSVQNMEVLLTSSIPDLSILNRSGIPRSSTVHNIKLKAAMLSVFLLSLYVGARALKKILKFKFMSDKEFKIMGIRSLGEIPQKTAANAESFEFSIVKAYSLFRKSNGGGKTILVVKYSDNIGTENILDKFFHLDSIKGIKSYRIDCKFTERTAESPAANNHIIPKSDSLGVFEYYDKLHINPNRFEPFLQDINALYQNYDNIIITIKSNDNMFVVSQLIKISNHIIFIPSFNSTKKLNILNQLEAIRELTSEEKDFCGLLTNVLPNYYHKS